MNIHYLEIVTNDVDREVKLFETAQQLEFGEPVPELGGARIAAAPMGGSIAVRSPLRDTEMPVVRPYFLTETIAQTVDALDKQGAEIALPPTQIEGRGTFAIYIVGGIEYGLWQI
jgi:predicted enzyme related to lactoylglutathione lyase